MTRMTPALARLLVEQRPDKQRRTDERPDEAAARAERKQAGRPEVRVPQQRTGVRLPRR